MNDKFYKDMADRVVENAYNQNVENATCDKCGSKELTVISYGLPGWLVIDDDYKLDPRIEVLLKEKRIVLGGCVRYPNSPKYYCRTCGNRFGVIE